MSIDQAFSEWRGIDGLEILTEDQAHERYHRNTMASARIIKGALRPTQVEDIQRLVAIANEHHVPLYAFSTGHDWGFGSSLPTVDGCVIVDLSGMQRVIEFNDELGYVTLEPGVTQQMLHDYMVEHNFDYMVPTTGAGPSCSIIGNALERGYGLTPNVDHFAALTGLHAVLPSGELYRSSFSEFGAYRSDSIYKWKVGPYLDGLFSEGNIGIVVQATIALGRKPERIAQFVAFIDDVHLEQATASMSRVMQRYGSMIGGANIMNKRRVLSMVEAKKEWLVKGVIPEEHLVRLARRRQISDWVVLIGIYSPKELQRGIMRSLRKEFRFAKHIFFLNRFRLNLISTLLKFLPNFGLRESVAGMQHSLDVLEGVPSEVALPLAYLKNPHDTPQKNLNPDRDGSGLIWCSPVLPMDKKNVREFTEGLSRIFLEEGIEPLITMTGISHQCFAANMPIVYNRDDVDAQRRARSCVQKMTQFSRDQGYFPDRLDIEIMRELYDTTEGVCFTLNETIKKAVDPNNIFAPGRYIRVMSK